MERLMLPGGIDIRGLEFIFRDPRDFGLYAKMRDASFKDLVDAGTIICGSPSTVVDTVSAFSRGSRIGNLHAMLQFGSMPPELTQYNIDLFAADVIPHLRKIWADEGWQHHWWPERLGGVPLPETSEQEAVSFQ